MAADVGVFTVRWRKNFVDKRCGNCLLFKGFNNNRRYYGRCLWLEHSAKPYWVSTKPEVHSSYGKDCPVFIERETDVPTTEAVQS